MSYTFKSLSPPLHATAEAAIDWFKTHWGIPASSIRVEDAIDPDISLRPTFCTTTKSLNILCIEVTESIYPPYIDAFVLSCRDKGMPVMLVIAVPKGTQERDYARNLKAAKRAGVGILEVDNASGTMIQNPLSLSLTGARSIDVTRFPKQFRQSLLAAEETFRGGNPAKGCASVYDELESLFRRFARKVEAKHAWTKGNFDINTVAWATLVTHIDKHLDRAACGCPDLNPAFFARVHGVTPFRNDSGHKPATHKALKRRDEELRTRFEGAVDLLAEFIQLTKRLKL